MKYLFPRRCIHSFYNEGKSIFSSHIDYNTTYYGHKRNIQKTFLAASSFKVIITSSASAAMECKRIQGSSSSPLLKWKYDVFVSFRGEDTRNNFTDHLFGALQRKGFVAFRDDTKLRKGEHISTELLQAIEESRILMVVFSQNYASSTWCLEELAKIADCIQVSGQTVLPIFYDVSTSEVRKQSMNYGKAFVEHEERFKENLEMVQIWREALTQVANLSGWDVRDRAQYAEIGKIVQKVACILDNKLSTLSDDIVGLDSPVEELEKLLTLDSDDVRVVGVGGMGGIGKTTLATAVYDKISNQFDASCFIDDIRKLDADYGPIGAQRQLLCQTLNEEENLHVWNLSQATNLIRTRLCQIKCLIILDNIDEVEQLDKLGIERELLGAGSRIVTISRDEHVLRAYKVDEVYKVQPLDDYYAHQLFCRKAFKCDDIMRDYVELIHDVLRYARGLPLAIKVLGSFLHGRDVSEWRSALTRLKENPSKNIMDVLRISFDALENTEKQIFLDIACFFYREGEAYLKEVLDFRGFFPEVGLRVLIDKSLITNENGLIYMHSLLRELGRSIVREKSPKEPRKWSRLWEYKDLHNVLLENMEAENLEVVFLSSFPPNFSKTTVMADGLSKMSHLKLLELGNVNFSGTLNNLSNELGYLSWDEYPFTCLPSRFQPDKLVKLILRHSNVKQLWEDSKPLHNLTHIDLAYSKKLIKMPDFRKIPNLESLDLEGCIKLVRIHPSIGILKKLIVLNLKNCKNLVSIPNSIFGICSLKTLNLSGCLKLLKNKLLEKPKDANLLKWLEINESTIQRLPTSSIYKMLKLPFHFRRHEDSFGLPLLPNFPCLPCLQHLDLSFCNLLQIPDAIGLLHSLEILNLGGNNFVKLPSSIKELSKLNILNLEHCKHLKYLPELPSRTLLPIRRETWLCRYYAGFYLFDCPKLSEMERCYSMAFCWMIQILKVLMQSSFCCGHVDIVIPGAQIPRWFTKQNMGGSISLDPSPSVRNENWIGIACCVAFVAHYDPTNLSEKTNWVGAYIGCGFQNKQGGRFSHTPIQFGTDLITVELNHMWLLFFTREEFCDYVSSIPDGTHDLDGIELATIVEHPQGLNLEVKECGYRWVVKEDLEQLNPEMTYGGSSSSRRHKFITND